MKLTQEVIEDAPSFISTTNSRTLSLRNLGLTSLDAIHILKSTDIHSTIDLSKNSITYLPEFPNLLRLETLILSNNHIRNISGLSKLVNLQVLSVTFNEILLLSDLEELKDLKALRALYMTNNPIMKNKDYRLWCIWRFPTLQVLDFQRVKDSERKQASMLFENDPSKVDSILSIKSTSIGSEISKEETDTISDTVNEKGQTIELTEQDREQLEKELEAAESLEEIQRIEEILLRGYM